ncbi:putative protein disulfide-isomerase A6 [Thelohanellus kitauei]|uniref:protein disulfide-isomerase n=1 Tax=Thelohanellus kitauei TaxID=669202 RepID=A0A0C2MF85_THEKT|nr:putative protein disulfide-isomerase A6 [Thelohanellus kitauei]
MILLFAVLAVTVSNEGLRYLKLEDLEEFSKTTSLNIILVKREKDEKLEKTLAEVNEHFEGSIGVAEINYSHDLPEKFKSSSYPAIKIAYNGGKSIAEYVKPISSHGSYGKLFSSLLTAIERKLKPKTLVEQGSDVVTLDESNFNKTVINSNYPYMIDFFVVWCIHCQDLEPEWAEAARILRKRVTFGAVDCDENKHLANGFNVIGYPTIYFIPAKSSNPYTAAQKYDGDPTSQAIVSWVESKLRKLPEPAHLVHVTSYSDLESECIFKGLCVMVFLPNRRKSDSKTWNHYINIMKEVIDSEIRTEIGWVWIEGNHDDQFEASFGINEYPTLLFVSYKFKTFHTMEAKFTAPSIKQFLATQVSKSDHTKYISGEIPMFREAKKWDGSSF